MQEQDDKQPKKNKIQTAYSCGLMQEQDDKQHKGYKRSRITVVV